MIEQPEAIGSSGLDVAIDRDAEVPIGVQLAWALRTRIRDGRLRPEQRLPGLRDMAEATGINVNTVRSVYQRLEHEGLIDSQQGSGTFVAPTLQRPSAVATIAADAAREAQATGVDPREVAAALYVAPKTSSARPLSRSGAARGEAQEAAERRHALRAQIAALERAIGEIEAEHPGVAPRTTAKRRGPGPTLLSAEELEQVRSALVRRLAAVQAAIDERAGAADHEAGETGSLEESTQKKAGPTRARTRARVGTEKDDNISQHDPASTPAPKRPKRPRSTGRPAAAGT
ncbi:MAG TPA: GntR family transcriptional regulator [Solirubrobacteraceae bacterium]|nr:GntR family transcriptional regulator [Solirubrobacteraceae bacterium]